VTFVQHAPAEPRGSQAAREAASSGITAMRALTTVPSRLNSAPPFGGSRWIADRLFLGRLTR
jgi:hypothetical protein